MDNLEKAFRMKRKAMKSAICAFLLLLSIFFLINFSLNKSEKIVEKISILKEFEKKERQDAKKIEKNLEIAPLYIKEESINFEKLEMDTNSLMPQLANMSYQGNSGIDASFAEMDFGQASLEIFEILDLDKVPKRIKNARIKYPNKMLQKGIEGEVRLIVFIDENGKLSLEKVDFATNEDFEKAAILALKEFEYEAPLKMGKKVKARFILPIPFKIEQIK